MEENEDVILDSSPEQVAVSEDVITPEAAPAKPAEKVVPYERFKKVNEELAELKKQPVKEINRSLDVEDYIDISASLEGLDQREKEYLAQQHKVTGVSLKDIRKDENFELWQSAYRAKKEKETLALKPTGTQSDSDAPQSFTERLRGASIAEKEAMLTEAGMYKSPRPRADRVQLGRGK